MRMDNTNNVELVADVVMDIAQPSDSINMLNDTSTSLEIRAEEEFGPEELQGALDFSNGLITRYQTRRIQRVVSIIDMIMDQQQALEHEDTLELGLEGVQQALELPSGSITRAKAILLEQAVGTLLIQAESNLSPMANQTTLVLIQAN